MDEPSAALTKKEVEQLYLLIDDLKKRGIGVVYVSHRLGGNRAGCRPGNCYAGWGTGGAFVEERIGPGQNY